MDSTYIEITHTRSLNTLPYTQLMAIADDLATLIVCTPGPQLPTPTPGSSSSSNRHQDTAPRHPEPIRTMMNGEIQITDAAIITLGGIALEITTISQQRPQQQTTQPRATVPRTSKYTGKEYTASLSSSKKVRAAAATATIASELHTWQRGPDENITEASGTRLAKATLMMLQEHNITTADMNVDWLRSKFEACPALTLWVLALTEWTTFYEPEWRKLVKAVEQEQRQAGYISIRNRLDKGRAAKMRGTIHAIIITMQMASDGRKKLLAQFDFPNPHHRTALQEWASRFEHRAIIVHIPTNQKQGEPTQQDQEHTEEPEEETTVTDNATAQESTVLQEKQQLLLTSATTNISRWILTATKWKQHTVGKEPYTVWRSQNGQDAAIPMATEPRPGKHGWYLPNVIPYAAPADTVTETYFTTQGGPPPEHWDPRYRPWTRGAIKSPAGPLQDQNPISTAMPYQPIEYTFPLHPGLKNITDNSTFRLLNHPEDTPNIARQQRTAARLWGSTILVTTSLMSSLGSGAIYLPHTTPEERSNIHTIITRATEGEAGTKMAEHLAEIIIPSHYLAINKHHLSSVFPLSHHMDSIGRSSMVGWMAPIIHEELMGFQTLEKYQLSLSSEQFQDLIHADARLADQAMLSLAMAVSNRKQARARANIQTSTPDYEAELIAVCEGTFEHSLQPTFKTLQLMTTPTELLETITMIISAIACEQNAQDRNCIRRTIRSRCEKGHAIGWTPRTGAVKTTTPYMDNTTIEAAAKIMKLSTAPSLETLDRWLTSRGTTIHIGFLQPIMTNNNNEKNNTNGTHSNNKTTAEEDDLTENQETQPQTENQQGTDKDEEPTLEPHRAPDQSITLSLLTSISWNITAMTSSSRQEHLANEVTRITREETKSRIDETIAALTSSHNNDTTNKNNGAILRKYQIITTTMAVVAIQETRQQPQKTTTSPGTIMFSAYMARLPPEAKYHTTIPSPSQFQGNGGHSSRGGLLTQIWCSTTTTELALDAAGNTLSRHDSAAQPTPCQVTQVTNTENETPGNKPNGKGDYTKPTIQITSALVMWPAAPAPQITRPAIRIANVYASPLAILHIEPEDLTTILMRHLPESPDGLWIGGDWNVNKALAPRAWTKLIEALAFCRNIENHEDLIPHDLVRAPWKLTMDDYTYYVMKGKNLANQQQQEELNWANMIDRVSLTQPDHVFMSSTPVSSLAPVTAIYNIKSLLNTTSAAGHRAIITTSHVEAIIAETQDATTEAQALHEVDSNIRIRPRLSEKALEVAIYNGTINFEDLTATLEEPGRAQVNHWQEQVRRGLRKRAQVGDVEAESTQAVLNEVTRGIADMIYDLYDELYKRFDNRTSEQQHRPDNTNNRKRPSNTTMNNNKRRKVETNAQSRSRQVRTYGGMAPWMRDRASRSLRVQIRAINDRAQQIRARYETGPRTLQLSALAAAHLAATNEYDSTTAQQATAMRGKDKRDLASLEKEATRLHDLLDKRGKMLKRLYYQRLLQANSLPATALLRAEHKKAVKAAATQRVERLMARMRGPTATYRNQPAHPDHAQEPHAGENWAEHDPRTLLEVYVDIVSDDDNPPEPTNDEAPLRQTDEPELPPELDLGVQNTVNPHQRAWEAWRRFNKGGKFQLRNGVANSMHGNGPTRTTQMEYYSQLAQEPETSWYLQRKQQVELTLRDENSYNERYLAQDHNNNINIPEKGIDWFGLKDKITTAIITDTIDRLPIGKQVGPDGVTPTMIDLLMEILPETADMFATIFDAVRKHGQYPDPWKEGVLVQFLKPGKAPDDVRNYRPITLLNVIGKWYDNIIMDRFWAKWLASSPEIRDLAICYEQTGFIRNSTGAAAQAAALSLLPGINGAISHQYLGRNKQAGTWNHSQQEPDGSPEIAPPTPNRDNMTMEEDPRQDEGDSAEPSTDAPNHNLSGINNAPAETGEAAPTMSNQEQHQVASDDNEEEEAGQYHRRPNEFMPRFVILNLDLKAAFDSVPYHGILEQMGEAKATWETIQFYRSYLDNRHSTILPTSWSTASSSPSGWPSFRLRRGVAQGGVASPIQFLFHHNRLLRASRHFRLYKFTGFDPRTGQQQPATDDEIGDEADNHETQNNNNNHHKKTTATMYATRGGNSNLPMKLTDIFPPKYLQESKLFPEGVATANLGAMAYADDTALIARTHASATRALTHARVLMLEDGIDIHVSSSTATESLAKTKSQAISCSEDGPGHAKSMTSKTVGTDIELARYLAKDRNDAAAALNPGAANFADDITFITENDVNSIANDCIPYVKSTTYLGTTLNRSQQRMNPASITTRGAKVKAKLRFLLQPTSGANAATRLNMVKGLLIPTMMYGLDVQAYVGKVTYTTMNKIIAELVASGPLPSTTPIYHITASFGLVQAEHYVLMRRMMIMHQMAHTTTIPMHRMIIRTAIAILTESDGEATVGWATGTLLQLVDLMGNVNRWVRTTRDWQRLFQLLADRGFTWTTPTAAKPATTLQTTLARTTPKPHNWSSPPARCHLRNLYIRSQWPNDERYPDKASDENQQRLDPLNWTSNTWWLYERVWQFITHEDHLHTPRAQQRERTELALMLQTLAQVCCLRTIPSPSTPFRRALPVIHFGGQHSDMFFFLASNIFNTKPGPIDACPACEMPNGYTPSHVFLECNQLNHALAAAPTPSALNDAARSNAPTAGADNSQASDKQLKRILTVANACSKTHTIAEHRQLLKDEPITKTILFDPTHWTTQQSPSTVQLLALDTVGHYLRRAYTAMGITKKANKTAAEAAARAAEEDEILFPMPEADQEQMDELQQSASMTAAEEAQAFLANLAAEMDDDDMDLE